MVIMKTGFKHTVMVVKEAGISMKYDKTKDVFYEEAPDTTWTLDNTGNWQPPTAYPSDGQSYSWNKSSQAWEINTSEG